MLNKYLATINLAINKNYIKSKLNNINLIIILIYTNSKNIPIKTVLVNSYYFNKSQKNSTNVYTILQEIFKSMYCLISKPVFKYTNDKVTIQLFYYLNIPKKKAFRLFYILYAKNGLAKLSYTYIKRKLRKTISRLGRTNLLFSLRKFNLTKVYPQKFRLICEILSKKYNKPVELELIRLHHPYFDSNILVNILALNLKSKKPIQKIWSNCVYPIPTFLTGLKLKIAGRLMGEPLIPRETTKIFEKGATGKANYVAKLTTKNKKGAYTIKITSSYTTP